MMHQRLVLAVHLLPAQHRRPCRRQNRTRKWWVARARSTLFTSFCLRLFVAAHPIRFCSSGLEAAARRPSWSARSEQLPRRRAGVGRAPSTPRQLGRKAPCRSFVCTGAQSATMRPQCGRYLASWPWTRRSRPPGCRPRPRAPRGSVDLPLGQLHGDQEQPGGSCTSSTSSSWWELCGMGGGGEDRCCW